MITGPTASGKSALAVEIARRLQTDIISADSRQVYHGIPIVTATPSIEQRGGITHHLIDMLPLDSYYSAAEFEQDSLRILNNLFASGKQTVVACGGSMLYVDALCNGIDELPTVPPSIRTGLMAEHQERGDEWLLSELKRLDPDYYNIVDKRNIKRVFHAVELIRTAGCSYTSMRIGAKKERDFDITKICLDSPRELLFERINKRVDQMIEAGLEEEARSVFHLRALNSLNTVGLKEMFAYFDGTLDRHTAIERIKKNTRVYAKKQITWWKRDPSWHKYDIRETGLAEKIILQH